MAAGDGTGAFRGASFTGADFTGANFRDCDLRQVKITYSWLVDVSLSRLVSNLIVTMSTSRHSWRASSTGVTPNVSS